MLISSYYCWPLLIFESIHNLYKPTKKKNFNSLRRGEIYTYIDLLDFIILISMILALNPAHPPPRPPTCIPWNFVLFFHWRCSQYLSRPLTFHFFSYCPSVLFTYLFTYGCQKKIKLVKRRELSPPVAMKFFYAVKWISGGYKVHLPYVYYWYEPTEKSHITKELKL